MRKLLIFLGLLFSLSVSGQMLVGVVSSQGGASSTLLNGLVGYYKLDESSGNAIATEGVDLTAGTGITYSQSGKIGTSFNFDGSNPDVAYLYSSTGAYSTITDAISISVWIKTSANGNAGIVAHYYWSNDGYDLLVDNGGEGTAHAEFTLRSTAGTEASAIKSTTHINDGDWHHIIVSWDKSSTNMNIYIDNGASEATTTHSLSITYNASSRFQIGSRHDQMEITGNIDEVLLYNRVLTSDERASLYNLTQPK